VYFKIETNLIRLPAIRPTLFFFSRAPRISGSRMICSTTTYIKPSRIEVIMAVLALVVSNLEGSKPADRCGWINRAIGSTTWLSRKISGGSSPSRGNR
jgi:hypothetical protein